MPAEIKATFFVAPNGNDGWSGRLAAPNAEGSDGPFATIARARDAIRALKAAGPLAEPVTVMLRGGTYWMDEPLVLGPEDSGTARAPIHYTAYPGERPVLSGGRRIEAAWRPWQGEVLVCDVPAARDRRWIFRQLAVNGRRQPRARLPRTDYYRIEEPVAENAFRFRLGDIRRWHNLTDVEVVVLHSWNASRLLIADVDEAQRVVTFTGTPEPSHPFGWRGAHGPNRYYVENVREGLDRPGAWYLDAHAGALYHWPTEDLATAEVVAPALMQLVRFEGDAPNGVYVEYTRFSGLTFSDTDWPLAPTGYSGCGDVGDIIAPSALDLEGARFCAIENCCLKNLGTYAIELAGSSNRIVGNVIYDTGSGGIITRNYRPDHNVVAYNHIHHCGATFPSAVGINIDDGGGIYAHNLIHHISHSGIYARHWATDHQPLERQNQEEGLIIEFNEIYDCMAPINDGAGIFVRDGNMLIRNNLIHDCYSHGDGTPGWGIYLGCRSRNSRVENNVVYRTRESVHIWYGNEHNVFENNIFVNGLKTQINYTNDVDTDHVNLRFVRNIICYEDPEASLFLVGGEHSLPVESDGNVLFLRGGGEMRIARLPGTETLDDWRARGFDVHSVVADPLFVDPANDDYRLRPDSPALKLGFRPIDLSTVGLRGSRWA